ncbi:MAG: AAA family ATPase [Methylophaga sp.]|uniref:ATP-dependent nuclease n=1 Tax=Methylophaga sp. TaxID=2024840 RepID=UPI00299E3A1D|nr:AAA family ATPase [Methylophaga sp.]MDX1749049.1 AAA family ATPase [Methylophaga sp.]
MKIESVRIENFRAFRDETVNFDNYNCLVGANGAGKSTIIHALNLFFRQNKDAGTDLNKLSENDFHHKNTKKEIKVTVTFSDLNDEAKESLATYVRQEKLIVTAIAKYDKDAQKADIEQYGNRLGISAFRKWFDEKKAGAKVPELNSVYNELILEFPELPSVKQKQAMEDALNEYEEAHPEKCELIPSADQFYGISKGTNKLAPFIQWVFVSASKDASSEAEESKTSALGQLLERAVRSRVNFSEKVKTIREKIVNDYQQMLDAEQSVLSSLSASLESRLRVWANPTATARVAWKQDPDKTVKVEEPSAHVIVGEKGFDGELARFGHGMQRSFLLSLLQELAELGSSGPTLIMGIEEPELYQHPPQAKYLSEIIQELSDQGSQILACSHSPYFIPGDNFSSVRVVREVGEPCYSQVSSVSYGDLSQQLNDVGEKLVQETGMLAKLYPTLRPEINEIFFCKKLILVEGIEDLAHITTYVELMNLRNQFRVEGWHIVPVGGKSELIRPICIAKALKIPLYVVFDGDTDKEDETKIEQLSASDAQVDKNKLQKIQGEIKRHQKDNKAILKLMNEDESNFWNDATLHLNNMTMWSTNVTNVVKDDLGEDWKSFQDQSAAHYGNVKSLQKNPLAVAKALQLAWDAGVKSQSLIALVENILKQEDIGSLMPEHQQHEEIVVG